MPKQRYNKRVIEQIEAIYRDFMNGSSMRRISRKHSLPVGTVEFALRLRMRVKVFSQQPTKGRK